MASESKCRFTPLARALRHCSVAVCLVLIASFISVTCLEHHSMIKRAFFEGEYGHSRGRSWKKRTVPGAAGNLSPSPRMVEADVETTNLTFILEHVEVDNLSEDGPWMYSYGEFPFENGGNETAAARAHTRMSWNSEGSGTGSCLSGGSGKPSRGYLDPYNYFLGLKAPPDFEEVAVELRNLSLADFTQINTINSQNPWNVSGEAGDSRSYQNGTLRIFANESVFFTAIDLRWVQDTSYLGPFEESKEDKIEIAAYFVAKIERLKSDDDWLNRLDPNRVGYVLGIVTAAAIGPITKCFSTNSYWITLRPYPDFVEGISETVAGGFVPLDDSGGAKLGTYPGSTEARIAAAETLSLTSKNTVVAVAGSVVGGAAAATAIALAAPASCVGPPGRGLSRLLATTAFVARVNEIKGFHTDAMSEFADGLGMFIGKLEWPISDKTSSPLGAMSRNGLAESELNTLGSVSRQEEDNEVTVSDSVFKGCALYTTLIVVGFAVLHAIIWFAMRKKPLSQQLVPHAWMIYIFSIVMSYVYQAALLNPMQYLRSHALAGTGKEWLYVVAVFQLLLVGVGFTAFVMTVMVLALRRVQRKELVWIPKDEFADPGMRQSVVIAGKYEGENDRFHALFECYYSSLAGPRVWIAALELVIVFMDSLCTALIWNEVICLGILVSIYAVLFILLLIFAPFVDKVEGGLVVLLGIVELVLLIFEFIAALGDFATAELMEFGGVILGFVSIGLAVLIAVYCDLVPIIGVVWTFAKQRLRSETVVDGRHLRTSDSDADSEWSAMSLAGDCHYQSQSFDGDTSQGRALNKGQAGALMAFNEQEETEVRGMLAAIFSAREASRQRRIAYDALMNTEDRSEDMGAGSCAAVLSGDSQSGLDGDERREGWSQRHSLRALVRPQRSSVRGFPSEDGSYSQYSWKARERMRFS